MVGLVVAVVETTGPVVLELEVVEEVPARFAGIVTTVGGAG